MSSDNEKHVSNLETTMNCSKLPGDELTSKIVELIEYYLSDENVLKDRFLLKHIQRNKQGYISVKLMASYRKVKSIAKDWKVVANSLKQSTTLELNSEGNRVRRKTPLPIYQECSPSTSVIAYKFQFEKPTVDKVVTLFVSCGDIFLIQILRPGCTIPTDVRKLFSRNPEMSSEICALIEFKSEDSVKMAMNIKEATVLPLIEVSNRNKKRNKKKSRKQAKSLNDSSSDNDKHFSRSSSVSSGYLSSSPRTSYSEIKSNLSTSLSLRKLAPSMASNRNIRENVKCMHKPSRILRLPRGPDGTMGFRDLRRAYYPIAIN